MADVILNLASLKKKADAAGRTTTATSSLPSLCPPLNTITSYVTDGDSVVVISGSYTGALLVKAVDVTIGTLLDNPVTVTGNSLLYTGSTLNLVTITNKPYGCTVYFKVGDNGSWTTSIPTSTICSTWPKIYWYASSTTSYKAKYSLSSPGQVSASMEKGDRELAWTVTKGGPGLDPLEYGMAVTISASPSDGLGDGNITYSTSNSTIAYTSGNYLCANSGSSITGSTCTVTATISAGTNWKSASCSYTVTCYNRYNLIPYVNLRLPSGTLWAYTNVGAGNPYDYGGHYKYGTTTVFDESSTYEGDENPLNVNRDVARLRWGGAWHTPTEAQLQELIDFTILEWTTMGSEGIGDPNGVYGRKFTSTRDSSKFIFLPAAEYRSSTGNPPDPQGTYESGGRYWSSTPSSTTGKRMAMYISYGVAFMADEYPNAGYSIRPVCDKRL